MKGLLSVTAALLLSGVSAAAPDPYTNYPTRKLTPGFLNPDVRQSTIEKTICVRGYSSNIRPPVSYTHYLKIKELYYYRLPGTISDYELDHFVPLSLGGSPFDTRNLWMESRAGANRSDPLEYKLYRKVCNHQLTLPEAQRDIVTFKRTNG